MKTLIKTTTAIIFTFLSISIMNAQELILKVKIRDKSNEAINAHYLIISNSDTIKCSTGHKFRAKINPKETNHIIIKSNNHVQKSILFAPTNKIEIPIVYLLDVTLNNLDQPISTKDSIKNNINLFYNSVSGKYVVK